MKLQIIKSKLNLIQKKLLEFKKIENIERTKPDYEKLFTDFPNISKELKTIDDEIFEKIESEILHTTKNHDFWEYEITFYNKSQLELLLFEIEQSINVIEIIESKETKFMADEFSLKGINIIIEKFDAVARQLQKRHGSRNGFEINDEYDVQDLFYSLLKLFFEDIRIEPYVPEYAGANSRIDFLLMEEKVAIEIKKTREKLNAKRLGEELIIDIARYAKHPDVRKLVCFVYDPDKLIENPKGIENDLSKTHGNIDVIVKIEP